VDKIENKCLPGAHIELKSLFQKGISFSAISDDSGKFSITDLPSGFYKLKVSYLGFKPFKKDSLLIYGWTNLGTIRLKPDSTQLNPVTIEENLPDYLLEADKKIYRAENFLNAAGGSALDALRNIPGIIIEPNGRLSLRGSRSVLVYIDGRFSGLTGSGRQALLQSIPADQIERIEIITNPGASYDAEGASGIINIVTKKSIEPGLIFGASAGLGTHKKLNNNCFFYFTNSRWNISAHYNFRYSSLWARGELERRFLPGDTLFFKQQRHWLENGAQHNARFMIRYQFQKDWYAFLEGSIQSAHKVESRYFLFERHLGSQATFYSDRLNSEAENSFNREAAVGFHYNPSEKKKHEFKSEISLSDRRDKELDRFTTQDLNEFLVVVGNKPERREQNRLEKWQIIQGRADYEWKPNNTWSFETGIKSTLRILDSDFLVSQLNYDSSRWEVNPSLTNHYVYTEWVPAGYLTAKWKKKRWSAKLGLRNEWTSIRVKQITQGITVPNQYLRFFPSFSLSFKVHEKSSIKLMYSRRINRPSPSWLNPFPDISDPLTIRFGNPYLNPEIIETGELTSEYKSNAWTLVGALYGRYIHSVMGRFVDTSGGGLAIQTFRNLTHAYSIGGEFIARYKAANWAQILSSANFYYFSVSGSNLMSDLNNSAIGGILKVMPEFRWKIISAFINAQIILPQATVQTTYKARYFVDAALRADLLSQKLSITLSLNDIFNIYYNYSTTRNYAFIQNTMRKNETLILMLNVTFKLFKKQNNNKVEEEPSWENQYED